MMAMLGIIASVLVLTFLSGCAAWKEVREKVTVGCQRVLEADKVITAGEKVAEEMGLIPKK